MMDLVGNNPNLKLHGILVTTISIQLVRMMSLKMNLIARE